MTVIPASLVFASARLRLVAGASLGGSRARLGAWRADAYLASLVFASARLRLVSGASLGGGNHAGMPAS